MSRTAAARTSGFPVLWPERAHRSVNLCWHNRPVKLARISGRVHLHGEGRAAYGLGVRWRGNLTNKEHGDAT
jgi:hypothetical protein